MITFIISVLLISFTWSVVYVIVGELIKNSKMKRMFLYTIIATVACIIGVSGAIQYLIWTYNP